MSVPDTLIIQSWFTTIWHPTQSVLNTARTPGTRANIGYLISDSRGGVFEPLAVELGCYGQVSRFKVPSDPSGSCHDLAKTVIERCLRVSSSFATRTEVHRATMSFNTNAEWKTVLIFQYMPNYGQYRSQWASATWTLFVIKR